MKSMLGHCVGAQLMMALQVFVWLAGAMEPCVGAEKAAAAGRSVDPHAWAVLIGAEKYQMARNLSFSHNDVRELAETLRRRGGYSATQILEMTDAAPSPRFQPLRASILGELPKWLKKIGA
ncbi:MAG: caspase family protein, partial [Candidatus Methanomethyliaceae archaeon]